MLTFAALLSLSLAALAPTNVAASGQLAIGAVGSDISWPQCGTDYPSSYSFGIVGVTGGHPFSMNDCFGGEFAWAQATGTPQLYINLDYGLRPNGPLTCVVGDDGCQAYNYGYDAAQWAFQSASAATNGASAGTAVWWLDVETENYWADDSVQNTYVIQGALDYLQRFQNRTVGVYSTGHQWRELTGSYAPPSTPNWVAGADNLDDYAKCSAGFWPGADVWAIQYLNYDLDLDQNRSC